MRASFFWRLYLGCVVLILGSTLVCGVWIERVARAYMLRVTDDTLRVALSFAEDLSRREWGRRDELEFETRVRELGLESGVRVTIVQKDGRVLGDSQADPRAMENHLQRPEVREALERGEGAAERSSGTVGTPFRYLARRIEAEGEVLGVVRAAFPLDAIDARIGKLRTATWVSGLVATAFAVLVALHFARRMSEPLQRAASLAERIASGDYRASAAVEGPAEIRRLSEAIGRMTEQLDERLATTIADRNKVLAILSGMVEGVIAVDREERVVHFNAVAARMLDVDPAAALGLRIWEVTRVREVCEILDEARRAGGEPRRDLRLSPGDGPRSEVELRASALRDASGAISGAVVVLHDVTALRRLETMRRDFVANVSHELKTPLTAIRGLVETMLDDPSMEADTARRFLGRVREQSLRLSTLVGDLLTLARIEANEERVERRPVDALALLRDCAARFGEVAARRGIALSADLAPPLGPVLADEESLRQIVDNLLDNACKYTPSGGRVWLRAAGDDQELRIEVQDTGIGIEPRDQQRVFERFYRVDKARSRELGGTGLGLSIVKHLVQALGGRVSLESQVGRGSTFRVHVPRSNAA